MLQKVINFLWLCHHNNVPIRDVFASRGINYRHTCPLCNCHSKTITHLLWDCAYAQDFWSKIRVPHLLISSSNDGLWDWLKVNCQSTLVHHSSIPWNILFPFAIWNLRKHRNRVVFENIPLTLNLHGLCSNQAIEYLFCVSKTKSQRNKVIIPVRWRKPPLGWCKLNTDGASFGNPGKERGEALSKIVVVTG